MAVLSIATARSEERAPLVTPMQDSDIVYDIQGPNGQVLHQRMRWRAATWQQRIDPGDAATFMLTDYRAGELHVIDMAHRTVTTLPAPLTSFAPPGVPAPGSWQQGANESIAGQSCTEWSSHDTDGRPSVFCYTADGLLIGATRDGAPLLKATSVSRAAQPTAIFDVPQGLHVITAASRP